MSTHSLGISPPLELNSLREETAEAALQPALSLSASVINTNAGAGPVSVPVLFSPMALLLSHRPLPRAEVIASVAAAMLPVGQRVAAPSSRRCTARELQESLLMALAGSNQSGGVQPGFEHLPPGYGPAAAVASHSSSASRRQTLESISSQLPRPQMQESTNGPILTRPRGWSNATNSVPRAGLQLNSQVPAQLVQLDECGPPSSSPPVQSPNPSPDEHSTLLPHTTNAHHFSFKTVESSLLLPPLVLHPDPLHAESTVDPVPLPTNVTPSTPTNTNFIPNTHGNLLRHQSFPVDDGTAGSMTVGPLPCHLLAELPVEVGGGAGLRRHQSSMDSQRSTEQESTILAATVGGVEADTGIVAVADGAYTSPDVAIEGLAEFDAQEQAEEAKHQKEGSEIEKPPSKWQQFGAKVLILLDGPGLGILMTLATLYCLFGDGIRVASAPPSADSAFVVLSSICLVMFVLEFTCFCLWRPAYRWSFFFALDILAILSLLTELPYIWNPLLHVFGTDAHALEGGGGGANVAAIRASRASRSGSRAGRLLRMTRLTRFLRLVKLYKVSDLTIPVQIAFIHSDYFRL
jgi:hypothetical protein